MKATANIIRDLAREIVSYNNDGRAAATRARLSYPRNYSANPISAAGILYRSRIESFPRYPALYASRFPYPPILPFCPRFSRCRPNFLIHEKWDRSHTRETELTRFRANFAALSAGALRRKFPRVDIYSPRNVHPFGIRDASILRLFMPRVLHKGLRDKSINVSRTFSESVRIRNSNADDYLLVSGFFFFLSPFIISTSIYRT